MLKSVRPKDLTDKISFRLTKINISTAYLIVRIDDIFKIGLMTGMSKKISTSLLTVTAYTSGGRAQQGDMYSAPKK